jgi:hypothetical protein
MGFGRDTTACGILDAIRAVHIEDYVVDAITSLVKDTGVRHEVDLVEGSRTILFFTKEEEAEARDEYEAAKAAGINVSVAEWLSKGEVEKVQQLSLILADDNDSFVDIRCAISGSSHPGEHDMASQARNSPVQTRAECLTGDFLEVAHAHACDGNQTQATLRQW